MASVETSGSAIIDNLTDRVADLDRHVEEFLRRITDVERRLDRVQQRQVHLLHLLKDDGYAELYDVAFNEWHDHTMEQGGRKNPDGEADAGEGDGNG